jgi:hypothetical protein
MSRITDREFNHAANDSPRSGSSKRVTPVVWCIIVAVIVALAVYFAAAA